MMMMMMTLEHNLKTLRSRWRSGQCSALLWDTLPDIWNDGIRAKTAWLVSVYCDYSLDSRFDEIGDKTAWPVSVYCD